MRLYAILVSSLLSASAFAAEIVKVGVYDFPPYAFITDKTTGISVQMIAAMNALQQKYEFIAVPTTARRRYSDFEKEKFDMMIFESKHWGWEKYPVAVSKTFVTGAEVYVTQAKPGRGQEFFSDFKNKAMVGVLGYHYKFAGFNADQKHLENNFNILQTNSQKKSLELILNNRGDIAVLSKEYLNYHLSQSPEDKNKLLISKKFDQIYQHTILVRQNSSPSISYINKLLEQMQKKGTLEQLLEQYGLEVMH
ncbi:amino acid ABC transporter substrate-binding protein [Colwellia sp. 75C3]|uniref:substrate-binding periplasmic protein n=1 Tax=Colwellia sp. 75C3 TaxID=888425 RepID=UPI000C32B6E6|nr:transporter substrate-binding domain-containing protein [Colwellia sp. 75C3]PKG81584.1 amino acid ABC transporter substrate-binding protein [Colwellia sp. 75C3]